MQISLTGPLEEMINAKVASGLYQDAAEVIRESLRFMYTHEEWIYQVKLEALRNQLQLGIEQLDAGDSVLGDDFFWCLKRTNARWLFIVYPAPHKMTCSISSNIA